MKILILSDSHSSRLEAINCAKYDAVIHCGDYGSELGFLENNNVKYVCGNCDLYGDKHLFFELFGKKVFVTHGDLENVKFGLDILVYRAMEYEAELCFFGHTHQALFHKEGNIIFINPGSYPNSYVEINEEKIVFYKKENTGFKKLETIEYKW